MILFPKNAGLRRAPSWRSLVGVGLIAFLLMLPEWGLMSIDKEFRVNYPAYFVVSIIAIATCLWWGRSAVLKYATILCFTVIYLVQIAHWSFFGRTIDPFAFDLLWIEAGEIAETLVSVLGVLYWVIPLVVIPMMLIVLGIQRYVPTSQKRVCGIAVLPLLILAFGVYRTVGFDSVMRTFPTAERPVMVNFLTAFGGYLNELHFADYPEPPEFAAYSVEYAAPPSGKTVLLIYSESMSATHMSVFGYPRETTPRLKALLDNEAGVARVGISAGISTRISTPLFFNMVRNPLDKNNILLGNGNLFRMAKNQGFTTYYYSAQGSNLLSGVDVKFIDDLKTRDVYGADFEAEGDEYLLKMLDGVDWSPDKNRLIVLHARSAHTPYEKNYRYRPDLAVFPVDKGGVYKDYMRNSYDNSLRYNDALYAEIFQKVKKLSGEHFSFWFTSDHGELIDHNGQYGHISLDLAAVRVPFMLFDRSKEYAMEQQFRSLSHITHVDFVRLIAGSMGATLIDPTPEPEKRYVSGTGSFARHGMMVLSPLKRDRWVDEVIIPQ